MKRIITLQMLLQLQRCADWTDRRVTDFWLACFGNRESVTAAELVLAASKRPWMFGSADIFYAGDSLGLWDGHLLPPGLIGFNYRDFDGRRRIIAARGIATYVKQRLAAEEPR